MSDTEKTKETWAKLVPKAKRDAFETLWTLRAEGAISKEIFERRALDMVLPPDNTSKRITNHLVAANRQKPEPWELPFESSSARWAAAASRAKKFDEARLKEAHQKFYVRARARTLTVEEAMMGCYVCILQDAETARQLIYHLLFEVAAHERVTQHNMYMLEQYEDAERAGIAERVLKLTVPLFPPFGQLKAINDAILSDGSLLQGGGVDAQFAPDAAVGKYFRTGLMEGGECDEPIYDSTGARVSALRMVGADSRLRHIHGQLNTLSEGMAFLTRGAGRGRGGRGSGEAQRQTYPQRGARRGAGGFRGGSCDDEPFPKNE